MMSTEKLTGLNLFSSRLKALRGSRKKAEFSRFLGVSAPLYHQWENGATPTMEKVLLIASKCNVSAGWLLSGFDDNKSPLKIDPSCELTSKAAAYEDLVKKIHTLENELVEARAVIRDQAVALAAALTSAKPSAAAEPASGAADGGRKQRRGA